MLIKSCITQHIILLYMLEAAELMQTHTRRHKFNAWISMLHFSHTKLEKKKERNDEEYGEWSTQHIYLSIAIAPNCVPKHTHNTYTYYTRSRQTAENKKKMLWCCRKVSLPFIFQCVCLGLRARLPLCNYHIIHFYVLFCRSGAVRIHRNALHIWKPKYGLWK